MLMQFTWHLIVIIAAILIGVGLFQKGEKTPNMSGDQMKEADMYRNYAYMLWGVAVAVAVYYYYIQNRTQKANMCGGGGGPYRGYMGSGSANMCGKAHMCGAKAYHY